MKKDNQGFHMGIGASTIFMIFVVLVMFILGILSYLRANSNYESMKRQINITREYYQSEAKLLDLYYGLDTNDLTGVIDQDGVYVLEDQMSNGRTLKLTFKTEGDELILLSLKTETTEE